METHRGSLKADERALTLNIERLILAFPGTFRYEEERTKYEATIHAREQALEKLREQNELLECKIRELTGDNAELRLELKKLADNFARAEPESAVRSRLYHTV